MAGDGNGWIHVYSCDENQDVTSFEAHHGRIMSLAVHRTDSYVLSSSHHDDHLIKLWHWDMHWDFEKGPWVCTRTFEGHTDRVSRLVFNREDPGCFASASWDGTVKVRISCSFSLFENLGNYVILWILFSLLLNAGNVSII